MLNGGEDLERGTPDWYLLRLGRALTEELPRFERLEAYDSGDHPLPVGNQKMRDTYRKFQRMSRSNYAGLIAESVRERCRPIGVVSGAADGPSDTPVEGVGPPKPPPGTPSAPPKPAPGVTDPAGQKPAAVPHAPPVQGQQTDKVAWDIWQANYLDSACATVHHAALALSRSYVMIGPNEDDTKKPYITPESPAQVIHEYDPIRPRWIVAALKVYFDPLQNRTVAIVYTPDVINTYLSAKEGPDGTLGWESSAWEMTTTEPNPIDEVPIVPFINRRERGGMGEFEDVLDIQDRINASVLDRMVTQAMQSYRQRWAKGVSTHDEDGNPQRPFDPGADLLWLVEDENALFGDFQQSDLAPLISASHSDVQDMAAISRTPPHYLLASVANVSGDALAAAEVGLTSKVRDRLKEFGEAWERVLRIAAKFAGTELPEDCSLVWADPERHTLAEISDAVSKFSAAGFPFEYLARLAGLDPQSIEQLKAQQAADQALKQQQQEAQLRLQAELAPKPPPGQPPHPGGFGQPPPAGKPPAKPPGKPGGGGQPKK